MARKRMIDPEFWTDDKTMKLSPRARLLFIGIWNFNDDKGIHKNSDYMLKAEIFPCDEITVKQVGELKDDLIKEGLIVPFQDNGIELFYTKREYRDAQTRDKIQANFTSFGRGRCLY